MGKRTAAAISEFQRSAGLAVDGRLSAGLLAALEARADSTSTPTRKIVAAPTSSGVRIGRVALTGEPRIRFHDDIVEPSVKVDTVFKEAEVLQLDTRKSSQRTKVKLAAEINEFTLVKASGWTEGLNQNADLELNAEVDNLEFATYSPYVVELAGVYLESGQLDLATASKATAGALQGELALGLDNIAFRLLSEKDAARVAGSVGVPLEMAVGLLQDSDGHIALNLPIQGTLQTPRVELASAVNKAIGGALKKVFPPTMVASMLSGVAKGGGATFEPIAFAPGSAELDDTGRAYADQLSGFLGEHPKLSLRICGRSTAQDNPQAKTTGAPTKGEITPPAESKGPGASEAAQASSKLRELAIERAQKVRNYLVKDRGTNTDQVPECRSTFDSEDSGQPRVEVSL